MTEIPSLLEYKTYLLRQGDSIGRAHRDNANMIMEQTWGRDIQSKKCYIYDYYHDDQPWLNEGMSYKNTTKTPIDAKFIITQKQSIDKDRVTVSLQFKPSQKLRFSTGDDLYYYETNYKNVYNANFPIGMFCDIPDEKGVYHKWIICAKQINNQFTKYLILPTNYRFSWVETDGNKRIIRRMWGATRSQNSYNSGLWSDYYTTQVENQYKAILPLNPITERVFYIDDENQNQRMIISTMIRNPRTWKVSKCEDMLMGDSGLLRLTFAQTPFNKATDFADYNAVNPDGTKDVYAMYADYYTSSVTPQEESGSAPDSDVCVLSSSTDSIKAGGSYKTVTATFYNEAGVDVTDTYISQLSIHNWKFFIDDIEIDDGSLITVLEQTAANKIKVKFSKNMDYLKKTLVVQCAVGSIIDRLSLEIVNL